MSDTFDENALNANDNKIPRTSANKPASELHQRKQLSKRSQQYDVDGDGKLDDIETAMRDMDTKQVGHLSNEKVYKILQEQVQTQRELFNVKRFLVVLSVFTMVLALSNLGTAFAAARLAKDSQVNSKGILVTKDGTEQVVGVMVESKTFGLSPEELASSTRRLDPSDDAMGAFNGAWGDLSYADSKEISERCKKSQLTNLYRECPSPPPYPPTTKMITLCGPGITKAPTTRYADFGNTSVTWGYLNDAVQIGNPCTIEDATCQLIFNENDPDVACPALPAPPPTPAPTPSWPTPEPSTSPSPSVCPSEFPSSYPPSRAPTSSPGPTGFPTVAPTATFAPSTSPPSRTPTSPRPTGFIDRDLTPPF